MLQFKICYVLRTVTHNESFNSNDFFSKHGQYIRRVKNFNTMYFLFER